LLYVQRHPTYSHSLIPLQVENESRAQLPSKQGSSPEQTSVLEESLLKLSAQLSTISRNQKYFRTRENRNFSTVKSTEKRIYNFSLMEVALMVTMAGLQVFVVRFFFQGARKGEELLRSWAGRTSCANWWCRIRMRGSTRPVAATIRCVNEHVEAGGDVVLRIAWVVLCGRRCVASSYHDLGLELRHGYQQNSIKIRINFCSVGSLTTPECAPLFTSSADAIAAYAGV
jgi:hypothetical protein